MPKPERTLNKEYYRQISLMSKDANKQKTQEGLGGCLPSMHKSLGLIPIITTKK
jgi:hypothetical protein